MSSVASASGAVSVVCFDFFGFDDDSVVSSDDAIVFSDDSIVPSDDAVDTDFFLRDDLATF